MGFKTYDKYKNSYNVWAGNIPEHWQIHKIKNLIFFQEGPGLRNWQFTDDGIRVICVTNITSKGIDFTNYEKFISEEEYKQTYSHFTVNKGDLLLSSSGNSWGKVAEYKDDDTVILNTSTIRINKNPSSDYELIQPYIKWALQSEYIREQLGLMMTGSCQPNFGPTHLAKVSVLMPTLDEQKQIANYLDKKTAKIDETIAKNEELIQLLEEKRVALINQVVTKGLDPNVVMKDSGVEWIGEIPEHWKVEKIKKYFYIHNGSTPKDNDDNWGGDICWITPADYKTTDIYINKSSRRITKKGLNSCGTTLVPKGSIIVSNRAPIGTVAIANVDLCTNQGCKSLSIKRNINTKFVYYSLSINENELNKLGRGTTFMELSSYDLGTFQIPIAPDSEQIGIIEYLDKETLKIDQTLSKIKENINLLEEYKTSLIHHVVTGKIDVRGEEI